MLSTLGCLVNIVIIIYLGVQAKACLNAEDIADINTAQNPLVLSCVAIFALVLATRNK